MAVDSYGRAFADPGYMFLRRTRVGDFMVVSAWIGVDQGGGSGRPLVFGRLVEAVAVDESVEDRFVAGSERLAATEEEALTGHVETVARLRDERSRFAKDQGGAAPGEDPRLEVD